MLFKVAPAVSINLGASRKATLPKTTLQLLLLQYAP